MGGVSQAIKEVMSSQERLLDAGLELFHRHGIHPVGLDRILSHAGVTKTTFYKYFETKEAFVCAVLDVFATQLIKQIDALPNGPEDAEFKDQLLGIFSAWDNLQYDKTFRGCLLIAAGVASSDPHDPARTTAIRNKRRVLEIIEQSAKHAKINNPARFAARLGALLDSSLIARQLYGDQLEAEETLQMAEE
jgi:AcrR family transcriptional regulator